MPESTPTKLHIVRCLTDVAKEHPSEAVRIFSVIFSITVLDSATSRKETRSLLFEIGIDIHRLQWVLPTSTYNDVATYIDNYRASIDHEEAEKGAYTHPFSGDY